MPSCSVALHVLVVLPQTSTRGRKGGNAESRGVTDASSLRTFVSVSLLLLFPRKSPPAAPFVGWLVGRPKPVDLIFLLFVVFRLVFTTVVTVLLYFLRLHKREKEEAIRGRWSLDSLLVCLCEGFFIVHDNKSKNPGQGLCGEPSAFYLALHLVDDP